MGVRNGKLLLVCSVCCVIAGCRGIGSSLVHRDQSNSAWERKRLRGVPITLEVPTHVRVTIVGRRYFYKGNGGKLVPVDHCGSHVKYDFIRTKKIFTVDPIRPAAGTGDWNLDLDNQYIKKATNNITDNTIAATSTAITNVISSGGLGALFNTPAEGGGQAAPASAPLGVMVNDADELKNSYQHIDSVIATRIFDIENPHFEEEVADFLRCHVNACETPIPHTVEHTVVTGEGQEAGGEEVSGQQQGETTADVPESPAADPRSTDEPVEGGEESGDPLSAADFEPSDEPEIFPIGSGPDNTFWDVTPQP